MKRLATTTAATLISVTSAFADTNISVERIGDMPEPFDHRVISLQPGGVYRLIFEGLNTNGEDLECVKIVTHGGGSTHGGLSCNWADPRP